MEQNGYTLVNSKDQCIYEHLFCTEACAQCKSAYIQLCRVINI